MNRSRRSGRSIEKVGIQTGPVWVGGFPFIGRTTRHGVEHKTSRIRPRKEPDPSESLGRLAIENRNLKTSDVECSTNLLKILDSVYNLHHGYY